MTERSKDRVRSSFDRVMQVNEDVDDKIFISIADPEQSIAQLIDDRPLSGLTFATKDNIDCLGLATTAACPSWSRQPEDDATVVKRLKASGAICVGKTNMDQFATGLVGTRSPYGVPQNVLDANLVPGGSSSGSAVAVARGLVDFALGTDTAGSGRVPAAHNGIVGLKPTRGLLSNLGVVPAVKSIDCVSIFARDINTAWRVFEQATGYDADDPYSVTPHTSPLSVPVRRIGIPSSLEFDTELDRTAWQAAINSLRDVEVVEIDTQSLQDAASLLYDGPWVAERYAAVGEFLDQSPADADPIVSSIVTSGKNHTAVAAYEAGYKLASIAQQCKAMWDSIDLLLVPSVPGLATIAEVETDPVGRNSRLGTYTNWVNLLDQCALALPAGTREDGLPYSVTLIGPAHADAAVVATAARLFSSPEPDIEAHCNKGFLEVAVVGAHLSGQPLNWQLTDNGGVFVRSTTTDSNYRLYAIANSEPAKPALVNSEDGATIELEVWRLPLTGVGQLLSMIPAPLGLGTVSLVDGSTVKGFIAEPRALQGATDITAYGGWRAYRASLS